MIEKLFLWIDFKKVRIIKIYCTKCKKYNKFKKPKISYVYDKKLLLSSIVTSVEVKMIKYLMKNN